MTLIPRKTFFGNPDRTHVRLSPDGKSIAFIAPYKGVMNIFVASTSAPHKAKAVTFDTARGLRSFCWLYTSTHIAYSRDKDGDENWQVRLLNLSSSQDIGLTPENDVNAHISALSPDRPYALIIEHNQRQKEFFDPYHYDLKTGQSALMLENPGYVSFTYNHTLQLIYASRMNEDGSVSYDDMQNDTPKPNAEIVPYDDVIGTHPMIFSKDGQRLYWMDSRERNTVAIIESDLNTGVKTTLATSEKADIDGALFHPETHCFEGFSSTYGRRTWTILDDDFKKDFDFLKTKLGRDLEIISRSLDNQTWIVVTHGDCIPTSYYGYNKKTKDLNFLFVSHTALKSLDLNPMKDVYIRTRDGLELVSYLTLPRDAQPNQNGEATQPVPLVLNVHGGPQARDSWGYDPLHQWLSNRGYAVLSVNFRSSTGFGKRFRNAGDGEWSRKMHEDLLDATEWAVLKGITTKNQIGIYGGSYGGYAALVGLTFTPDVFACAVDIVGPSSLVTLLESVPPYWKPVLKMLENRLGGNLDSPEGRQALLDRSPIEKADRIERPLLIGQGANDPRVKQTESDQIVAELKKKNIPVSYLLFPDEGHGFARPENRLAFFAIMEAFLKEHLGGRFEPIKDDFMNSSHQILEAGPEIESLINKASS